MTYTTNRSPTRLTSRSLCRTCLTDIFTQSYQSSESYSMLITWCFEASHPLPQFKDPFWERSPSAQTQPSHHWTRCHGSDRTAGVFIMWRKWHCHDCKGFSSHRTRPHDAHGRHSMVCSSKACSTRLPPPHLTLAVLPWFRQDRSESVECGTFRSRHSDGTPPSFTVEERQIGNMHHIGTDSREYCSSVGRLNRIWTKNRKPSWIVSNQSTKIWKKPIKSTKLDVYSFPIQTTL